MPLSELLAIAIACMLLALGLASIGARALRRDASARLLIIFGVFCVMYGARLLAQQPLADAALGGSRRTWNYAVAFLTYGINVPCGLFVESLIGAGWKQSIRRFWQFQAVYAVAAIAVDTVTGRPGAAMPPNTSIVLVGLAIAVVNLWMYRRRLSRTFATPVIAGGGIILLLLVLNHNLGRPLMPSVDLEPVGVLAFVAALGYGVLESVFHGEAELLAVQRELETAREIQRSLLPREPPRVQGVDLAVRYLPMTAVAGDLYDFVVLGPSTIGVLVADVSGHGVPAALVASMVKLAFSTQADHARDPARVLTAMNRVLSRQLKSGFVTAVYAVMDRDRGSITVANAGHPPLLIGHAGGTVEAVDARGLVMGFLPDATYTNSEIALHDGDLVFLYTDGVTEACSPEGRFFDGERVTRWLAAADGRDPARLSDAALGELMAWRGRSSFEDDVTFVLARVAATPARSHEKGR